MSRLAVLLVALGVASPALAQAPTLSDARIDVEADDVRIVFDVSGEVEDPRVSIERGALRLRFSDARRAHFDVDGDGRAIRFVRVREGLGDAVVAVVRLGDMRTLDEGDVSISNDGAHVALSIDRDALPTIRDRAPEAELVVEAAPPAEAPAPEAPTPAPAPRDYLSSPPPLMFGADDTPPSPTTEVPAPLGVPDGERASHTMLLLMITGALAVALGVVRWVTGRKKKASEPIQVLCAHRLSAKHQLLLVRALGQDHLLSVDGARTERIFSQASPEGGATPSPESLLSSLATEAASEPSDFAAKVAELAQEKRDTVTLRSHTPAPRLAPHQVGLSSEAVAGLLRLRTRAVR